MGKKKSFLNKKNAATFRLVCRDSSASDPFGLSGDSDKVFTRVDNGTNYIPGFTDDDHILSADTNTGDPDSIFADAEEDLEEGEPYVNFVGNSRSIPKNNACNDQGPLPDHIRKEILELGLPDDGYNYLTHMREIRVWGGGSFLPNPKANLSALPADVKAYDASKLEVQARIDDDSSSNALYAVSSRTRHIRNIGKAADPEVLANLDKSDSEIDSEEELDEDFVIQANKPDEEEEGASFVRSSDIRQEHLHDIQSSSGQDNFTASSFKKCFDVALQFPKDDMVNGVLKGSEKPRSPRPLDEQFELLALQEYSDGENDTSDVFDYDAMGGLDVCAPEIDHAMKEYLTNNLDFQDKYSVPADLHVYSTSTENPNPTQNKKGATVHDFTKSESQDTTVDDVIRKCAIYAQMYENESEEEKEIVVVEDSGDDEVWDCETIVSTYSNLDNHPAKIDAPQKPGKKAISDSNGSIIFLRGRQQLPADFLPKKGSLTKGKKEEKSSEMSSKVVSHARVGETLEQKKARKVAVKEEKREARRAKKELKGLYRGESQRAQHVVAVAGPPAIHLM